jgi:hypothetical protein
MLMSLLTPSFQYKIIPIMKKILAISNQVAEDAKIAREDQRRVKFQRSRLLRNMTLNAKNKPSIQPLA